MKRRLLSSLLVVLLPAAMVALAAWLREPGQARRAPAVPLVPAIPVPPAGGPAREIVPEPPAWPSVRYEVGVAPELPEPEPAQTALRSVKPWDVLAGSEPALPVAVEPSVPADRWSGRVVLAATERRADHWFADAWARVSPLLSAAEGLSFFVPDPSPGSGVWMPTAPARAVGGGLRFRWSF